MVDKKFGYFQWDLSSQTGSTRCAPDGCASDWLGYSSPGKINRKNMVISRKKIAYQRVETTSSKASPPDISQESKLYFNSHTNGQHSGFDIFEKNGGNQESENDCTVERDLGNSNFKTDHNYCGVPAQLIQQSGGLGILLQSGLIRMGPLSTCLSQSLPEIRNPNSRFIRFKGVTPNTTICCMETISLQHSHGRNVNSLDTGSLLRISSILSAPPCTKQNTTRPSTHSNIDNTLLANAVVVSTSVENANKETNFNTKFNHTFSRSKRESPSMSVEQNSYISGMVGFLEGLSLQGVSEETT